MSEPLAIHCESQAHRVTLFEDRAEVLRRATAEVPAGIAHVHVRGIGVALYDPSLIVTLCGPSPPTARILSWRVQRLWREEPAGTPETVAHAEAEYQALLAREEAAKLACVAAERQLEQYLALAAHWLKRLRRVPQGESALQQWQEGYQAAEAAKAQAFSTLAITQASKREAEAQVTRAKTRRDQLETAHPRIDAMVVLDVAAEASGPLDFELLYRTPCALWRPEHLSRLELAADGSATLQLRSLGVLWQATGERWSGVQLRLSTARPAQAASPPLLADDVLTMRRKSDAEQRTVAVSLREQAIARAGSSGARQREEMPGVDDGGQVLSFDVAAPLDIPSTGEPCRVVLGQRTLPCTVSRTAYPELSLAAYQVARATLTGSLPLLAGPVHLMRQSSLVGKSRIDLLMPGLPFELSMGTDDAVRVRRRVDESRETTAILGTQKIERTVTLYLSNMDAAPCTLDVVERIPVSEIAEVRIQLIEAGGGVFDEQDGFLRFTVTVPASGHEQLAYRYRIEAASKVALDLG